MLMFFMFIDVLMFGAVINKNLGQKFRPKVWQHWHVMLRSLGLMQQTAEQERKHIFL